MSERITLAARTMTMIGRTLRQYLVTARIGEGGMGVVWKARDTTLDRDVALKVLPAGDSRDAARRERFVREAKAASALNHPSIITIYEINSDQDIDYIAMECVDGETLAARLRRGALSIEQVLQYATQIADAVGKAHTAGIVHRDLKPGNIMITGDGLVKVLDFGLAKVRHAADAPVDTAADAVTRMTLTRVGTTMGTIGYMSPEQSVGDLVDSRSDVFSFGAILYEMLTGICPFAADSSVEALQKLHLSEPPAVESVRPDVPPHLAAILQRAMAKQQQARHASLAEVAAALRDASQHLLAGGPGSHSSTSARLSAHSLPRPPRWWRSRGVGLVLGIAALASIAAGAAWRFAALRGTEGSSTTAVLDTASAYELAQQAAALLARDDRERNVERAIELLERALSQDQQHALAHAYLAEAYRRQNNRSPDPQWLKLARDSADRAMALNPDLAAARMERGFVLLHDEQVTESASEFRRAADLDPVNPLPHVGLAMALERSGRDGEASDAYERAIQLAPLDWRAPIAYGDFLFRRARHADAIAQWEAARRLTPDNVRVLQNLGAAYFRAGEPEQAASVLQRALEVHPRPQTYTNLGTIRYFQARYTDAATAFEKAVELGANRHLNWANLADAYRWAPGRRSDAPAAYRRASELIAQDLAQRPDDADLRTRHAVYLAKFGDRDAALRELDAIPRDATLTAQMQYRLSIVYELAEDRARALQALERALAAGYPVTELLNEPEFTSLRADVRYHRLASRFTSAARK